MNYYGTARSNYFQVKDTQKFKEAMNNFCHIKIVEQTPFKDQTNEHAVMITLSDFNDSGFFPEYPYNDELEDDARNGDDLLKTIADHLKEGEVAILMEIGSEGLRYLCGSAQAVNSKNERSHRFLEEIYTDAEKLSEGKPVSRAEY